ncbi:FecCD family ABC transporter permease [Actinotalea soli]|uniref:FecCD family ABC transporter permease n=1 Tax=Actinotalea soli TaxID=2819234 RepID=UPI0027DC5634|nr:iron ABC transporter permease [Actinotalea soli]
MIDAVATESGAVVPTPRSRARVLGLVLLALVLLSAVLATSAGAVRIAPSQVLAVVWSHVGGLRSGGPAPHPIHDQIVWSVRVPRVLLALIAGAGLAVAGTVLQAVVGNPLADPYVLGVSAGASAAAVAVFTLGAVGGLGVSAAAFAGALVTLVLVLLLGQRDGRVDPVRLLLAGVALGYLFQAVTSYLQLRQGGAQLQAVLFWLLGTLSGAQWSSLALPALIVIASTAWLLLKARALNALVLGDEVAASLGLRVGALRLQLLVVAALLTAAVIAVAGGIGFVGLIAPHAVRLVIGTDHRALLPLAALTGGVFLILADLVGRTAAQPVELPLTVVTALVGVPFFLVLLRRQGRPL